MLSLTLILFIILGIILFGVLVGVVYFIVRSLQKRDEAASHQEHDSNLK